jgi:putative copper resistance protein D
MIPVTRSYFWLALLLALSLSASVSAQLHTHEHATAPEADGVLRWEGSPDGIAYSEFNHHLAAACVLLIGLSELGAACAVRFWTWTRFVLPGALLVVGVYLFGWSDHEAWPVGSLSIAQTFVGGDLEIVQHKLFAVLLLGMGTVEGLRWSGKITGPGWAWPLPMLAVFGGLLLFVHDHGHYPGGRAIMMHHLLMGTIAIAAGSLRLATLAGFGGRGSAGQAIWRFAWPGLLLLLGLQLLLYTE